ncbi:hypothetical protein EVAR_68787_1 [Eumeta japonica]|uniref:Uncharacterized protein n=1 Tax=Eumeta variegata TaxID=151549 RepID=A0A4C1ZBW0_EUMVA|nr:hypothetical protein EVAR_68787_1 [Eumeta japonica]
MSRKDSVVAKFKLATIVQRNMIKPIYYDELDQELLTDTPSVTNARSLLRPKIIRMDEDKNHFESNWTLAEPSSHNSASWLDTLINNVTANKTNKHIIRIPRIAKGCISNPLGKV